MFEDEYRTINAFAVGEFRDRGSRFMGLAYPVKSEAAVKELVQSIRKEHPKANHHCYAFRLGPTKAVFRYTDDREPSGSAGKPIFGVIQSNDLTDILIVVVRYFGGTLLGVPGLIQAYREAAAAAIANSTIVTLPVVERYLLEFEYSVMNEMMTLLKMNKVSVLHQETSENCRLSIEVIKQNSDLFLSRLRSNHLLISKYTLTVI